MAKLDESIPPVPLPPTKSAATVPPVETKPKVAKPAAAAAPAKATVAKAAPAKAAPAKAAPAASTAIVPAVPGAGATNPYTQPAYTPAPAGPPQGIAIASMITGIAGIVLGGFIFASLAAVITGHLAQKRQPYARGFWITGLITGYVGIGIALIVLVFWILWFVIFAAAVGTSYSGF